MNGTKMTNKQKRFCDEYLIDLNATQSAIRAGYSPKTAYKIGQENLMKPQIKAYIEKRMKEKEDNLIASQDEVLRYLTSVLRGQSESEIVVVEGCGDGVSQAVKIKKTPDERERLKAGELLAKRYGILSDKVKLDGVVPVVIGGSDDLED